MEVGFLIFKTLLKRKIMTEKEKRMHKLVRQLLDEFEGLPFTNVMGILDIIKRDIQRMATMPDKIVWDENTPTFIVHPPGFSLEKLLEQ